jgi:hypothetical protein
MNLRIFEGDLFWVIMITFLKKKSEKFIVV